jgi:hypothetical protein
MNERIKELEQQCWSHRVDGTLVDGQLHFDTKKFAELIVKKCIEQASIGNGHGNNQWDRALTFSAKNIKEHFGVEE